MFLPINKNTKLLIFDCDGTIANNMNVHINAWINVLKNIKIKITSINFDKYNGLPIEYILKNVFNINDYQAPQIANKIKKKTYKLLNQTKPIKPIVNLIKYCYNKIPMIVLSGGKKLNVYKTLDILKIRNFFDIIITNDDNHPSKNNPLAFTILANKYNLNPRECHVFEDGVPGLISALKAGMTVTDVRNIQLD